MDASEPRVRRRGFFLHSDTAGEPDTPDHENPEGFVVRVRIARPSVTRQVASHATRAIPGVRLSGGRSRTETRTNEESPD
jgi:hypothetical protein